MSNVQNFSQFVQERIEGKELDQLKNALSSMFPGDLADGLEQLDRRQLPIVFRLLPKQLAVEVFDLLDPGLQGDLIESFSDEQAAEYLAFLDPDDRVHLLDELPARVAKKLLGLLPKDKRDITNKLLGYEDGTVGRIMSPMVVDIKRDMTVVEALKHIRKKKNGHDWIITTVYVTDDQRAFEGAIPLSELVTAEPDTRIAELLQPEQISVRTIDSEESAARMLQDRNVNEIAVLDRENRLVGVLTSDDAIDVLEYEATSDMYAKAGLVELQSRENDRSYALLNGSIWHVMGVRVPFLFITLLGGILAGAVIGAWEETLEAIVATAFFIPVVMDMGGNVGTQSSTIFTRGLVLGQISMNRFTGAWLRESWNGLIMGLILGLVGGAIAWIWQGMFELGLAIALSLTFTITIAASIGFLVPWVLVRLGFDQAAGSDPFITTIKDISGLMIYFSMVSLFVPMLG